MFAKRLGENVCRLLKIPLRGVVSLHVVRDFCDPLMRERGGQIVFPKRLLIKWQSLLFGPDRTFDIAFRQRLFRLRPQALCFVIDPPLIARVTCLVSLQGEPG